MINHPPAPGWERHFDLALLRDVIEHLDETETALANIRKVLKPGGHLVLNVAALRIVKRYREKYD